MCGGVKEGGRGTDRRARPYMIWAMALLSARRPNMAVEFSRSGKPLASVILRSVLLQNAYRLLRGV